MSKALDGVVELLDLEQIEVNILRGRSPEGERRQRVFGQPNRRSRGRRSVRTR